jgi:hypothetical protein
VKFFTFSQNNSGGGFHFNDAAGIANYVIVEAESAEAACAKAEAIGLYFDGCASNRDCDCCGDRWHRPYDNGDDVPLIYGADPRKEDEIVTAFARESRPYCYIHFANGDRNAIVAKKDAS